MKKKLLLWVFSFIVLAGCHSSWLKHTLTPEQPNIPLEKTIMPTMTPFTVPTLVMTPFPKYIQFLVPEPAKKYTIAEYENLAPSIDWNATLPSVCVSIAPGPLLETGDFPTTEEWLTRMRLVVDDQIITEYHSLLMTKSEGRWGIDPQTGKKLWQEPPGSPLCVCYAASLGIGVHTATLVLKKTSGAEANYSWQFVITE